MKKRPILQRVGDFLEGKGFYIVLLLCVAAVGISGYYLFSDMGLGGGDAPVGGQAVVRVTPTPTPVTPRPTPAPTPAPTPTPAPALGHADTSRPAEARVVYTWPVKGEIINDFSLEVLAYDPTMGDWRTHSGLDLAAELGAEVLAISGGTVREVFYDDLMGTTVVIDHSETLSSSYANLAANPPVKAGDEVTTGAVIGSVGDSAVAEQALPAHLHFEMEEHGEAVDPIGYLPPR
ncbi:MAG: M23 family metallopeptidase [Clostridiales bacterium]|nr:M23 family metallopeptidase [Clostridiales bacterium]